MNATANILRVWRSATPEQRKRGRLWYPNAHKLCRTLAAYHGLQTEQVAGALAALSPVCSWENNVRSLLALVKTDRLPPQSTYPANVEKARRILNGEHPSAVLGGFKVRNFYLSILRPHGGSCCIDRHAVALATRGRWGGGKPVTPRQYKLLLTHYRRASKISRQPLTTLQAVCWTAYRDGLPRQRRAYGVQTNLYTREGV